MVRKKRLLFLSHRLPYPPHNGAAIRTFNILKQLAREFQVTALCFDRADPATAGLPRSDRVAALSPYAAVEVFAIPQQVSWLRKLADHARSLVTGRAYTYYLHQSSDFEERLRYHLTQGYDLVHLDSLDLVRFAPMVQHLPTICTHHNVESQLLFRRANAERSALVRSYMNLQARLVEQAERDAMPGMALNIAVSAADAAGLQRIVPGLRTAIIPNGVDVETFQPSSESGEGCVFVGGTSWFPNKDGLEWFVEAILPELESRGWRHKTTWVGRASSEEITRYGRSNLRLVGYVEDIRPYVHAASCFIVPLRVGGGTRLKVLDAWAMGKAVVSTRIGCEGLDARHGENVLLADSPAEFAEAVLTVSNDAALRGKIGAAARETAVRLYSWEGLGVGMRRLYHEAAGAQVVSEGSTG